MVDGDPRPSIEERYPSHTGYVNAVTAAAQALGRERLLRDEDVRAYVQKAKDTPIRR
jgi:hypothetical protein